MRASGEIYELIKSLTKEERGFFRKFASSFSYEGNDNYIKLFDEIMNQVTKKENYDEDKIRQKSFSGKFQKNFPYHKNYLYNMILSSMVLYNKDKRELYNQQFLISEVKFLYDKVLYDQSYKVLLKAKRLAYDDENFNDLQNILIWERLILRKILGTNDFYEKSIQIYAEQEEVLGKQKNTIGFGLLHTRIGIEIEKSGTGFTRNEKDFSVFDTINKDELMKDESKATSFTSKFYFHNIKMQYFLAIPDYTNAYHHTSRIVELFDSSPGRITANLHKYVVALHNLYNILIRVNRFDDCGIIKEKLIELRSNYNSLLSENDKILIFYSTSTLGFSPIYANLNPELLLNHLDEVTTGISVFEDKVHPQQRIILYYFLGVGFFVLGNHEKCIHWMGKIINSAKLDQSEDYQAHARIVNLLSYFELGYFDSLEYVLKSTYHYLNKRQRVYKYETIILRYLRRSFRVKTQSELYEMFAEMNYELQGIFEDDFEKNAFDTFNILYWLESKIEKKTLIEIMKGKSK